MIFWIDKLGRRLGERAGILDIGAMNDGVQQQAQRIYQNYVVLTAMVEKRTFPD